MVLRTLENRSPLQRPACFYVTIFERFQYFNFKTNSLENENLFQKTEKLKALKLKTHHFHTKLRCQKSILRQIEWWAQNGPTTKNVLPVTALFFRKFCFSLRTSYKELIWYTNDPNAHIPTFCERLSFISRCFFPESNLNKRNKSF